ncbi:integration host factor subunit alpha [Rhodoblastus sp.]|uniref:integration host factor subunit alpha n=1 Tax=Rhodoblastus sp. TaxID=1962975 RepID=UPI003F9724D4
MNLRQYKKLISSEPVAADKARGDSVGSAPAPASSLGKTTTRVELLDAVYTACPSLSRAQARDVFEITLEEIAAALLRDEPVKLRSFGAFHIRSKRERVGRNPRTGVEAKIEARRVLTFKPSPTLIARVNGEQAEA